MKKLKPVTIQQLKDLDELVENLRNQQRKTSKIETELLRYDSKKHHMKRFLTIPLMIIVTIGLLLWIVIDWWILTEREKNDPEKLKEDF